MRVAACMSGEMRNRPDALASVEANIFAPIREVGWTLDLLLYVRKDAWWQGAASLPFRMLHVEENRPEDDADIRGEYNPPDKGAYEHRDARGEGTANRRAFLYQSYLQYYRSLGGVAALKRRAEEQDGAFYDWVMRVRFDTIIEGKLDLAALEPGMVHVPSNDRWPFENLVTWSDKWAMGSSLNMDRYFDRRSFLREWCAYHELHAEALLGWQMRQLGIPVKPLDGLKVVTPDDLYRCSWRPDRERSGA